MHPKKASGAPNSTLRTRPSLYNNNNNNNHNKNPRIHPQSSNPPKHYNKLGRPMDPLAFIVFFLHDIARTAELHTNNPNAHQKSFWCSQFHSKDPTVFLQQQQQQQPQQEPKNPRPEFKPSKTL